MGTPTIPNIDLSPPDFEALYHDHLVATKNNYDVAGNAAGALATSLIPKHPTAEYRNLADDLARAYQRRLSGMLVNIREHGAVGDGVTDNTAAFMDAIMTVANEGVGHGVVFVPAGDFFCDSPITPPSGVHIRGVGRESHLSFVGSSGTFDGACVGYQGALTSIVTIDSAPGAAIRGSQMITMAAAPALAVGDIMVIQNPTHYSFSPDRAYYRDGEFCRVTSVVGNVVRVDKPLFETYDIADGIVCFKITPAYGSLQDLRISGRNNDTEACLRARFTDRFLIRHLYTDSTQYAGVSFDRSIGPTFSHLTHFDHGPTSGLNYGLAIDNSQSVRGDKSFLSATRHGLSTGGAMVDAGVPCRDLRIENTEVYSTLNYSGDMHANTAFSVYQACTFGAGISFGGNNNSFLDCHIWAENNELATNSYCMVSEGGLVGYDLTIERCHFYATQDMPNGDGQMLAIQGHPTNLVKGGNLRIVDNKFHTRGLKHRIMLLRHESEAVKDAIWEIKGNRIHHPHSIGSAPPFEFGVQINAAANCWLEVLDVSDNISDGVQWYVSGAPAASITIEKNKVHRAGFYGIRVSGPLGTFIASKHVLKIENNTVRRVNRSGILVGTYGATDMVLKIKNNASTQIGQYGAGLRYAIVVDGATGCQVICEDNLLGASGASAQGAMYFRNLESIQERNNIPIAGLEGVTKISPGVQTSEYLQVSGIKTFIGSGSPETYVSANPGSMYHNTSGGAGTSLYVKETGFDTTTGWGALS